jgi:hypothetical protein
MSMLTTSLKKWAAIAADGRTTAVFPLDVET